MMCLMGNALHQHFAWRLCRRYVREFRCWLLMLAMATHVYGCVQKLVWRAYAEQDGFVVLRVLGHCVVYVACVALVLCRDGMRITFPRYFTVVLCLLLIAFSCFSAFFIRFGVDAMDFHLPDWFCELQKIAYFQVSQDL